MVLATLAFAALQASKLTMGSAWSGELHLRFVDAANEIDQEDVYQVGWRITGHEGDWLIADRSSKLLFTKLPSGTAPGPGKDMEPLHTEVMLSPQGWPAAEDPFDLAFLRLERLMPLTFPPADATLMPKDNKLLFSARLQSHRLTNGVYSFTLSEDDPGGIRAKGQVEISASGRPLQVLVEADNAPIPGSTEKAHLSLSYRDSKLPK